jgi:protein-disulfide isomerase
MPCALTKSIKAALALLMLVWFGPLACHQPSAEIEIPQPIGAEPTGLRGQSVIVEAPSVDAGPILDWRVVDDSLAQLVDGERYRVDYDAEHPWIGAGSPLVTIVVFSDYQCPYSHRLNGVLISLVQRYPQQLRLVWRQFPLEMHRDAKLAAAVAIAAHGQGQFGLMHDWLFANNRSLTPESIERQAAAFGLDIQRLHDEVDNDWYAGRVEADIAFGKRFGVRATPSYFVNGRPFKGAQSLEDIDAIVREELLVAERLLSAGAHPDEVWARILAASAAERSPVGATGPSATPTLAPAPAKHYATALSGLPERGAKQPKVQILMCGDFDCPYCQRSTGTLEQLLKDHKGDLAIYYRHHPLAFHTTARAAHRAAVAAENQGQFWPMYDALYAAPNQRSDAEIEAMAKQLGLDMKQFRRDIADPDTDKRIDEQAQFCEQDLDAKGTPTFFINGWMLSGAQPITAFEQIIQRELASSPSP